MKPLTNRYVIFVTVDICSLTVDVASSSTDYYWTITYIHLIDFRSRNLLTVSPADVSSVVYNVDQIELLQTS